MQSIEFHCHTIASKDSLTSPEKLLAGLRRKKIDRVVVTDHNTIKGALQAYRLAPERVIVGEEIMTTRGELLAAFVKEEIPPGLEPEDAIDQLRQQGAFISVSHPYDRMRKGSWQEEHLLAIIALVDAIEIFNARNMWPFANRQARRFAQYHQIPSTVGSDAHASFEIGKARMLLPEFNNAEELEQVIRHAKFRTSLSAPWVHFASRYAVWYKKAKGIS